MVEKSRGEYSDPSLGRIRLREFWPRFVEATPHLAASTRLRDESLWTRLIDPVLGFRRVASLTPLRRRAVGRDDSREVRRPHHADDPDLAAQDDRRCCARRPRRGNVASGVKVPKVEKRPPRLLTPTELRAIVDAVPERERALVLLLGFCGLRAGEALALQVKDVDLLRRRVSVTKGSVESSGVVTVGPTRSGRSRSVVLPAIVHAALAHHMSAHSGARDSLLFTSAEGGVIRRANWRRRVWLPALRRAEIDEPWPRVHDLRHTAASLAIAAGANVKGVQEMLGNSSVIITLDTYSHLMDSAKQSRTRRDDLLTERNEGLGS